MKPLRVDASIPCGIGVALFAVLLVAYATTILAILGVISGAAFVPAVVVGSSASLILLALFFHRWLIVGCVSTSCCSSALGLGWSLEGLR